MVFFLFLPLRRQMWQWKIHENSMTFPAIKTSILSAGMSQLEMLQNAEVIYFPTWKSIPGGYYRDVVSHFLVGPWANPRFHCHQRALVLNGYQYPITFP